MKFLLLTCLASLSCTMADSHPGFNTPTARDTIAIYKPLPLLRFQRFAGDAIISATDEEHLYEDLTAEERFKRSLNVKADVEEDREDGEIVEEKDIPQDANKVEVSTNSEYEELPSEGQSVGRSKRATVTVIRIRNKRTGKVTYIIIRRR